MKNQHTYIKITEDVEEDTHVPSESELMLDNYSEEEYTTPYTTYGNEEFIDMGETFEVGGIFDDR